MKIIIKFVNFVIIFLIILPLILSYKMEPGESAVHQKITKEAIKIWKLQTNEIKNHSGNSIDTALDFYFAANFDEGDDIITGSGEEDRAFGTNVHFNTVHFWDSDDPNTPSMLGNDDYNDGLGPFGSAYRRALNLWTTEVIPSYLRGDINRSYYYLGRVAHLLEDAAQPSHVLLDPHAGFLLGGNSILEDFTGNISIYPSYNGSVYEGLQYNYDNLIEGFDWSLVQPTRLPDKNNVELFRLFWYTTQKTQYWASDDRNGNQIYVGLNGNANNWQCGTSSSLNLWKNESYSCSYIINESANLNSNTVEREANATIPHSMKAVAGLYRLFDDAVRIDWPTENHDFRRTGFTLLKGDLAKKEDLKNNVDFFLDAANDNIHYELSEKKLPQIEGLKTFINGTYVYTNDSEAKFDGKNIDWIVHLKKKGPITFNVSIYYYDKLLDSRQLSINVS